MKSIQFISRFKRCDVSRVILTVAGIVFVCGLLWQHPGLLGSGAVALCLSVRAYDSLPRKKGYGLASERQLSKTPKQGKTETTTETISESEPLETNDKEEVGPQINIPAKIAQLDSADTLVQQMLAQDRYALLLRPETSQHLTPGQVEKAVRQLDEAMSIVPDGSVWIGQLAEQASQEFDSISPKLLEHGLLNVAAAYLDRYPVTNRQFQQFVDSGGYDQLEYWPEEALPALLGFVDQTGFPGPRFWEDSCFSHGEENHPVVGVSWYEASAYAHWAGKRLPSDAEWTKASAWPVESAPGRIVQRRYPWGDSYDVRRANIWQSGVKETVPVDQYTEGGTMGGLNQTIGNVWEWTNSPRKNLADPTLYVPEAMVSIRGGAFDTYFENQATCHYESGEYPLSRKHNIGFRLALALSVLEPTATEPNVPLEEADISLPNDHWDNQPNKNTAC